MNKKQFLVLGTAGILTLSIVLTSVGFAEARSGERTRGFDFSQVDTNGDGLVTQDEIDAMGAARIAEIDADGDGRVTAEDLAAVAAARVENASEQMAARAAERTTRMIERLDTDGDGALTQAELEEGFQRRGSDRGNMIERLDTDGDSAISKAEFEAAKERFAKLRGEGRRGGDKPNRN